MRKIGTRRRRARALQSLHSTWHRNHHAHVFTWVNMPDPLPDVGACWCGLVVQGGKVTIVGGSPGITGAGGRATLRGKP